jgi:cyclophilin family peptidyl-prolyl cis-trans isomerase
LALAACGEANRAPERPAEEADLLHRILTAEDSRSTNPQTLSPLAEGLTHPNAEIRRITVRAVGRLERAGLISEIQGHVQDSVASVRAEAANALAQSVRLGDPAPAKALLTERLSVESDEGVKGVIAESLGRLRQASAEDAAETATTLVERAGGGLGQPFRSVRDLRVAKGFYLLARQPFARQRLPENALAWLRATLRATPGQPSDSLDAARARTLAIAALAAAGHASPEDFDQAYSDSDPLVRREALAGVRALHQVDSSAARDLVTKGLEDPAANVRYAALVGWESIRSQAQCAVPERFARDPNTHVKLRAIELLASCPGLQAVVELADSVASTLPAGNTAEWHAPASAIVSLAFLEPRRAEPHLTRFAEHPNAFVRAYAARAASVTRNVATLETLSRDADPNVRTLAIEGLSVVQGRAADPTLILQLEQDDPQLLITASRLLSGSTDPRAAPALLTALERLTAARRETQRDARLALLERVGELSDSTSLPRIRALLQDFDPTVAAFAANMIGRLTGGLPEARAVPLPQGPVPTAAELDALEGAVFTIEMAEGGSFDVRLRAWDAPTNAARFARLAEAGYYDGLTYHRVAPNFVIQGGSPAANEYAGDGPYTRDELGLDGHWRGTVGISTRGRDTGDAQMFVNLIDNVRLDHDYTVFGEVVSGMDVVDGVLEGAVIRQIRRSSR